MKLGNIKADVDSISHIEAVPSMLEVICRTTGMGFAAVARVTEEKWIACAVHDEINFGLEPGGELVLKTTLCNEIRQHKSVVVIDNVAEDKLYANHHTPATYGFKSYISMPIILKSGEFFGTLCAIDPNPALLNNVKTIGMFTLFADLIAFHLEAHNKLAISELKLLEEKKTSELRDLFIAILGHDLRNPVSAVLNVAQILLRISPDDRTKRLGKILQNSSYRMKGLIDNILDFARGRLGDGIVLNCCIDDTLEDILNQVITELRVIWPDRGIVANFNINEKVSCDSKRIAQMVSNLLGNALTHGKKDEPVTIDVYCSNNEFIVSVSNFGEQISAAVRERLFQPFARGDVSSSRQGLGLGLYIASEIARAHNGKLDLESTGQQTIFTFKMPLEANNK